MIDFTELLRTPEAKRARSGSEDSTPEKQSTDPMIPDLVEEGADGEETKKKTKKVFPSATAWYPGRGGKIPGHLTQSDVNDQKKSYWEAHREEWAEAEPMLKHIVVAPGGGDEHGLACEICMAYRIAHPGDKSCSRCQLAWGKQMQIRKADLLRHVQGGSGTLHQRALAWKKDLDGSVEAGAEEEARLSTMHARFCD